jgi:hypothetical protein
MPSDVEIANMALAHLGVGNFISNLATDDSDEADAVNSFLETVRAQTLRDFPWPFATKTADLGLIEENPNGGLEWGFSYAYPSDCLEARRIPSGIRMDTVVSRVPFRVGYDGSQRLIFCDIEDAQLEYTVLVTDTTIYPPDFVMAMSYRLAWHIAARLASNYSPAMTQGLMQMYAMQIAKAKANAANEESSDRAADSEWISGR